MPAQPPRSACARRRSNPRQRGCGREQKPGTFDAALTPAGDSGSGGHAIGMAALGRSLLQAGAVGNARQGIDARRQVIDRARNARARQHGDSAPAAFAQSARRMRAASCSRSCACRQRRPWPMTAVSPHPGQRRGSQSGSNSPGLHPASERGIRTITGCEGSAPESNPFQGHSLCVAPPSLLSIRIRAEKELNASCFGRGKRSQTFEKYFPVVFAQFSHRCEELPSRGTSPLGQTLRCRMSI